MTFKHSDGITILEGSHKRTKIKFSWSIDERLEQCADHFILYCYFLVFDVKFPNDNHSIELLLQKLLPGRGGLLGNRRSESEVTSFPAKSIHKP